MGLLEEHLWPPAFGCNHSHLPHHHLILGIFSSDPSARAQLQKYFLPFCVLCRGSLDSRLLFLLSPCCLCPVPGTCLTDTLHLGLQYRQGWSRTHHPSHPRWTILNSRGGLASLLFCTKHCSMNNEHSRPQIYGVEEWEGKGLGRAICSTLLNCSAAPGNICLLREGGPAGWVCQPCHRAGLLML